MRILKTRLIYRCSICDEEGAATEDYKQIGIWICKTCIEKRPKEVLNIFTGSYQ